MALLEETLEKLLVSDTTIIQQGTHELKEAFKNPDTISELCNILVNSTKPTIRQYASVLLRKRLTKEKTWKNLKPEIQNGVKQCTLHALTAESERCVKNAIVQLIGVLVRHEFPFNSWPELLQLIQQLIISENMAEKELGMYTLSIITDMAPDQFLDHVHSFALIFENTMLSLEDPASDLAYYTVVTMMNCLPLTEGDVAFENHYLKLIPNVISVVNALSVKDEKKACEVMEIFEEMMEGAISVVKPHLKDIIEMCLKIGQNTSIDNSVRVKAIHFIGWIACIKSKAIITHQLVESTLEVLFGLMCMSSGNDNSEEYFVDDVEGNTPFQVTKQTLGMLAFNLPPENLIPPLLQHLQLALQGQNLYAKKGSYIVMAVLSENCTESLRTYYMEPLLQWICEGLAQSNNSIRNAALYALQKFSVDLQPDISKHASIFLPVLLDNFTQLCNKLQQDEKEPPGMDLMVHVIELLCTNSGEANLPYLPTLINNLFTVLNPKNSIHLRERALRAMRAAANAVEGFILPYFPQIIECLKLYLTADQPDETICLQIQALETVGVLARTLGAEHFLPLGNESIQAALRLLKKQNDTCLKRCLFCLFASVSTVMKKDMHSLLPDVIDYLLLSTRNLEVNVTQTKEADVPSLRVYEEAGDSTEEEPIEDEEEDAAGCSAEDKEREIVCQALREIAANVGEAFEPYLDICFNEVFDLVNYYQEDVQKAALGTLTQLCINLSQINTPEGKKSLQKALLMFVLKLAETIRTDKDTGVVKAAVDAYAEILREMKGAVLEGEGHKEIILNCIKIVMQNKTECQYTFDAEEPDHGESDLHKLLIESTRYLVPNFGKAMNPEEFSTYFGVILPLFAPLAEERCTVDVCLLSISTLSDSLEPLGPQVSQYVPQLLPLFLQLAGDANEEIRNVAIFGLGEFVFYGKEALYQHYPEILNVLSAAVALSAGDGKEQHPRTLDIICGAIARLIITNMSYVPLDQVFPVFTQYLPLREYFADNKVVFQCISYLFQAGHPMFHKELNHIIRAAATVLNTEQADKDTQDVIVHLIKNSRNAFPQDFENIITQLPPELSMKIKSAYS